MTIRVANRKVVKRHINLGIAHYETDPRHIGTLGTARIDEYLRFLFYKMKVLPLTYSCL
jgi:hypothetical protein